MPLWITLLLHLAVIAYAVIGGVFLAFSDFIMRALSRTGDPGGLEAMQVINREVFRWVFMALFLGLAPVSLILIAWGGLVLPAPAGTLVALAGLTYLLGCFGVTVAFNVPMNEALAGMDRDTASARAYWTQTYVPRWTFWNTVRTGACCLSAVLLLLALTWLAAPPLR